MAKIKTNKSKKESKSVKTNSDVIKSSYQENPSYRAEQIENGWIVEKSYTDKDGRYKCEKVFHENNPFEKNPMEPEEED